MLGQVPAESHQLSVFTEPHPPLQPIPSGFEDPNSGVPVLTMANTFLGAHKGSVTAPVLGATRSDGGGILVGNHQGHHYSAPCGGYNRQASGQNTSSQNTPDTTPTHTRRRLRPGLKVIVPDPGRADQALSPILCVILHPLSLLACCLSL